jgi:hypothetical protein
MDRNKISVDPHHLGVRLGVSKMMFEPIVRSMLGITIDQNEFPLDPRHVGVQSTAPKMISEPMVCLAQTMHLSCVEINTVSKLTEASYHFTHVT